MVGLSGKNVGKPVKFEFQVNKNIDYMAFDGCSSLESLTIKAIQPPTFGYYPIPRKVKTIYVPKDSVDAYKESMTWTTLNIQPIA